MEVSAEAVALAVNAANAVRKKFDAPLLDALPPGVRADESECILARAFNFDCEVDGQHDGGDWSVRFPADRRAHAEVLAEALSTDVYVREGLVRSVYVTLPPEVAAIAAAFDDGDFGEDAEPEADVA